MKNLFKDCATWDEAKTLFRKLSKTMHPDLGGTNEQFVELKRQFEMFTPRYSKDSSFANQKFDRRKFADIIEELKELDEVEITFAGTFIWIEGDTYSQKDKIKAIQLQGYNSARYAPKKKAWYFSPIDYKKKSKKLYNMDDIKQMFGADSYKQSTLKLTI